MALTTVTGTSRLLRRVTGDDPGLPPKRPLGWPSRSFFHYHDIPDGAQARRRTAMLELTVNGEKRALEIDPGTPLLWALRDHRTRARSTAAASAFAVPAPYMSTGAPNAPAC
jgi:hypothetical protein